MSSGVIDYKREDERLQLSRRKFFFFGAILAAKPEIVVPTDDEVVRIASPHFPFFSGGDRVRVWLSESGPLLEGLVLSVGKVETEIRILRPA